MEEKINKNDRVKYWCVIRNKEKTGIVTGFCGDYNEECAISPDDGSEYDFIPVNGVQIIKD